MNSATGSVSLTNISSVKILFYKNNYILFCLKIVGSYWELISALHLWAPPPRGGVEIFNRKHWPSIHEKYFSKNGIILPQTGLGTKISLFCFGPLWAN